MSLIQKTNIFNILKKFGIKNAKKIDILIVKKDIFIYLNFSYYVNLLIII